MNIQNTPSFLLCCEGRSAEFLPGLWTKMNITELTLGSLGENVFEKVDFVKFEGETWIVPGCKEAGLYSVGPWRRAWFLDNGRRKPMLAVSMFQVPLAPAFARSGTCDTGTNIGGCCRTSSVR